ncbi:COG3650 family protein [Phenylobacterium sp.]|uniref:COG3650 family protein n=1 Tax=Phenylobacterium sp. TaxID=1871053 RepID=UPI002FE0CEED
MRLLTGALALLLAACQPQDPNGTPAPPPADAPPAAAAAPPAKAGTVMDLSQPLLARGNEPFWAVRIDGTTLTLMQPGVPDVAYTAPGAQVTPDQASWEAKSAEGQTLAVTVYASECSDGMSDMRYAMSAEATVAGRTMTGCAGKASELTRPGGS